MESFPVQCHGNVQCQHFSRFFPLKWACRLWNQVVRLWRSSSCGTWLLCLQRPRTRAGGFLDAGGVSPHHIRSVSQRWHQTCHFAAPFFFQDHFCVFSDKRLRLIWQHAAKHDTSRFRKWCCSQQLHFVLQLHVLQYAGFEQAWTVHLFKWFAVQSDIACLVQCLPCPMSPASSRSMNLDVSPPSSSPPLNSLDAIFSNSIWQSQYSNSFKLMEAPDWWHVLTKDVIAATGLAQAWNLFHWHKKTFVDL